MAQFALRWILDHEAVSTVIPGASKVSQVLSNAKASALDPVSEKQHEALYTFYKNQIEQFIRGPY
jgi:aryl-alcohol dehydrogenase-like predicted oxidoreductase